MAWFQRTSAIRVRHRGDRPRSQFWLFGGAIAFFMTLFGVQPDAHATLALFNTYCSGCHGTPANGVNFNAAGNAAVITASNTAGMGAGGTLAEHASIATYIDSIRPSVTNAPVPFNTATVINIPDIVKSAFSVITAVSTVTGPSKGVATTAACRTSSPSTAPCSRVPNVHGAAARASS